LQKQAMVTSLQLDHKNTFINELKEKIKQQKEINLDKILKKSNLQTITSMGFSRLYKMFIPIFQASSGAFQDQAYQLGFKICGLYLHQYGQPANC
jgi:hypothetical protein